MKMNGKRCNYAMLISKSCFATFNFEFKNSFICSALRYKIKTAHKNISGHIFVK